MAQAVHLIQMNLKKINEVKDECKVADADMEKFEKKLEFKGFDLEIKHLPYPMTVCTDEACKQYVYVGNSAERNTIYPQICHHHCNLQGVPVQTTNNEQLRGCQAMAGGENCTQCKHNYRLHMHQTYTAKTVEKVFLSPEMQDIIQQKADAKSKKEAFIAELERSMEELKEEHEFIYESASYFGVFLKENALIPYNDSFSEYLEMLIKDEETKEKLIRDDKRIEQLKKDKQTYEKKKEIIMNITSASEDKNDVISTEKIEEMRNKLCSLKHNGKNLNEALGIVHLQWWHFSAMNIR